MKFKDQGNGSFLNVKHWTCNTIWKVQGWSEVQGSIEVQGLSEVQSSRERFIFERESLNVKHDLEGSRIVKESWEISTKADVPKTTKKTPAAADMRLDSDCESRPSDPPRRIVSRTASWEMEFK